MKNIMRGAACAALACVALLPAAAFAEPNIIVTKGNYGSLTAPGTAFAEEELRKIPGGADVVPARRFQETYALSMKDMLATTPGVFAQTRYNEESRLSIRGSGLSRGFHLRGLMLLQDGIPFNFADGGGDFQEIDPLVLQHIEVYRGGQALRYGAATLGGAINMVTPTAKTAGQDALLRAEGGSFGTLRLHAQAARDTKRADIFAAATESISDGFRKQSAQENTRFGGNAGAKLGDKGETRLYVWWNDIKQEVPGTISKNNALHHPRTVPAVNVTNDYARDVRSLRLADRAVFALDNGMEVEAGGYVNRKSLYHPIFQVIDQESVDTGIFARLNGTEDHDFTLGLNLGRGGNDADRYVNVGGNRGAQTANAKQVAENVEIYGENRWHVAPAVTLSLGLQGSVAVRDYTDHNNAANNARKVFRGLNPKAGALINVTPEIEAYASITRSSEFPTFSELVQGAVPGFVPVSAQTAWTGEIGTRGKRGRMSWDATLYRARVQDEMLQFTAGAGIPASTFNAGTTVHQGLELGLGWQATPHTTLQAIYNINDFHFIDDAQYGDNRLAGAPVHQVRVSARYENNGFHIEPNVEWIPQAAWVDYANTLKADSYAVLGVAGGWDAGNGVSIFLDARNVTGEDYISSFSTITDAGLVSNDVFYPGEAQSVFGGVKMRF